MEKYLIDILFMINIFGGPYDDPEKTPDSSKAGEQTGEAPTELIELAVFSWTLEFEGKFPPGSESPSSLYSEAFQAPYSVSGHRLHNFLLKSLFVCKYSFWHLDMTPSRLGCLLRCH